MNQNSSVKFALFRMNCPGCEEDNELVQIFMERNHELNLKLIEKEELIQKLRADIQTIGAKYRDTLWQRNLLHATLMNPQRTDRYREIANEN